MIIRVMENLLTDYYFLKSFYCMGKEHAKCEIFFYIMFIPCSLLKLEQICSLSISCFNLSLLFSIFQVHP